MYEFDSAKTKKFRKMSANIEKSINDTSEMAQEKEDPQKISSTTFKSQSEKLRFIITAKSRRTLLCLQVCMVGQMPRLTARGLKY